MLRSWTSHGDLRSRSSIRPGAPQIWSISREAGDSIFNAFATGRGSRASGVQRAEFLEICRPCVRSGDAAADAENALLISLSHS